MDVYGYYQIDDAVFLAEQLKINRNLVFTFTDDRGSAFVITIMTDFKLMNSLGHGGSSIGRVWVGVLGFRIFHFDFKNSAPIFSDYVAEKMGMTEGEATPIAELLNAIKATLNLIPPDKSIDECFQAGRDCAVSGETIENCHFSYFATVEKAEAWCKGLQEGKQDD